MPRSARDVTPAVLRDWPLPAPGTSKHQRGRVLIVGGAARTPGAVQLSGLAALRVGAGHLTLAVARSAAVPLAVVTPEAAVIGLAENDRGSVLGGEVAPIADDLAGTDVVVVGPGLDDAPQAAELVRRVIPLLGQQARLVLDAFALSKLPEIGPDLDPVRDRLLLTPNGTEAEIVLGRRAGEPEDDVAELADRFGAVVSSRNVIGDPGGSLWRVGTGHSGLATSGSGDVMAGALAGLLARGADSAQAACWAAYLHAAAGDRLAARVGRLGFLAREILDELPAVLVEVSS